MITRHFNIPIFIPELACPHQCVFCNQRKITDQISQPTLHDISTKIEQYLSTIPKQNSEVEIAFFGGSFTGIPVEVMCDYLKTVQPFLEDPRVNGIRVSTRPDYINLNLLQLLKNYGVTAIELGAQSLNDNVLKRCERGHSSEDVAQAATAIKAMDFELGLQMMVGLPDDTAEQVLATADQIIALKADTTRIYPCLVIKDSALEQDYLAGKYQPLSLEKAVELSAQLLLKFEAASVTVLRIGLHASEGLRNGESLVAGPFSPAFKELVETEIWKTILLKSCQSATEEHVTIFVGRNRSNSAIGFKASNKKELLGRFKSVNFHEDYRLKGRACRVNFS